MKKLLALLFVLVFLVGCVSTTEPVGTDANPPEVNATIETTTEQASTTLPAPREWPGVPQAYWAVLDDNYGRNRVGYALVDINRDGIDELLILQDWHDGFIEIIAIYTYKDGEAVNLVLYNPTSSGSGRLAEDGTLFMYIEWRDNFGFTSHQLEPGATTLTELTSWRSNIVGIDDDNELIINYYRGSLSITAEEYYAAYQRYVQQYRNPPNPMQFEFVPLGQ